MHVLKRSAGIGSVARALEESVEELAEAFMVLITATGFLEVSLLCYSSSPAWFCPIFVSAWSGWLT